jgi:hypothetical protein
MEKFGLVGKTTEEPDPVPTDQVPKFVNSVPFSIFIYAHLKD